MSIKKKILLKLKNSEKTYLFIEGINGGGKTTFIKQILKKLLNELILYLWSIYFFKKSERLTKTIYNLRIRNKKKIVENIFILNIAKKKIHYELENYSSGQKKKIIFSGLFSSQSYDWYLDEPKTYLDEIFYLVVTQQIIKHLTIGGKIIFTSNQRNNKNNIQKKTNKISLSRLELLTYRLSSDRSKPTEL